MQVVASHGALAALHTDDDRLVLGVQRNLGESFGAAGGCARSVACILAVVCGNPGEWDVRFRDGEVCIHRLIVSTCVHDVRGAGCVQMKQRRT